MHCCREPFSGFSHLAGAILAAAGVLILVTLTWDQPGKMLSMLVYGTSMVLLYSASAVLHLIDAPHATIQWFSRLDHAAIYAVIAGTYTPFCYNLLSGGWRWGLLGTIWTLAVLSMIFKLVFHKRQTSGYWGLFAYIGMGWSGVIASPQLIHSLPTGGIGLVLGGGLIYSIGTIFYALDRPCCRPRYVSWHDIWHICVLAGSVLHFTAVLKYLV